ncbi:HrpB1 family type III secretion system apparatus protein [Paraburkholderia youngii]|uniref:HrpB1 family type III secretion system apparatus protein n=1 Tax=Paraburkholderia youngii TaxID=2782701 RepID=UPI003D257225
MSGNFSDSPDSASLARAVADAIKGDRLDEAEARLAQLYEVHPAAREALVFPTVLAIRRGHTLDALRHLNSLPEGKHSELKALCLYLLGDQTWHRYAEENLEDPDPYVRNSMLRLLGRINEKDEPG